MARPVVASGAAAEGIDHDGTILCGNTVGELADAVSRLLAQPQEADAIGEKARERVQARYAWRARLAPLDALISGRSQPAAAGRMVKSAT